MTARTPFGRELVLPDPVIVEVDELLRGRVGDHAARSFLDALAAGEHAVACLSSGLLRRAAEIDARALPTLVSDLRTRR